ncbi:PSPA7_2676 family Cys-rich small protein [Metapseudomonas boanensis]|uniref:PSPA7_2676 family Cys-rich small protein n=1 Tax=Metapseudomonas boanensis TaxID=2822138 RepID=UPI00255A8103|nr:PSPA7_2676 family Cys-rich small protein [Pseudomonas boanensis]
MRIRCFLLGCIWNDGFHTEVGSEPMICQRCRRCGAHRYVSQPTPEVRTKSAA